MPSPSSFTVVRIVIVSISICLSFAVMVCRLSLRKRVYLFCKDSINASVHNEMIEANSPKEQRHVFWLHPWKDWSFFYFIFHACKLFNDHARKIIFPHFHLIFAHTAIGVGIVIKMKRNWTVFVKYVIRWKITIQREKWSHSPILRKKYKRLQSTLNVVKNLIARLGKSLAMTDSVVWVSPIFQPLHSQCDALPKDPDIPNRHRWRNSWPH